MNYKTKIFLQSLFVLTAFAVSLQAFATWVPPIGTPPTGGNTKPPINTSSTTQAKDGGLVAWDGLRSGTVLIVDGASDLKGNVTIFPDKTLTINTETYTFPVNQTANGYLKTDGAGNLTWDTAGGGGVMDLSWDTTNHEVDITGGGTSALIPFASGTANGLVSTLAQTFAGAKTFNSQAIFTSTFTQNNPADNFSVSSNVVAFQTLSGSGTKCVHADNAGILSLAGADCGSGGEANTASNLGGGLANFDSKSGVDLRFNSFNASDFNLASNLISIDYVNGQTANGSTKGFLSGADWTTFNNKMTNPMTTAGDIIYGGASGAPTRLGIGSAGQVLTVSSGVPVWAAAGGGAPAFNTITTGTNTAATMTVGSGASLLASGTGTITANQFIGSGSTTINVDLASAEASGTLPIGKGGTGKATLPAFSILITNSLDTIASQQPGALGSVRVNAAANAWENFVAVDATAAVTQSINGTKNFTGTLQASGLTGLTQTLTVRNSAGTGTCTITVTKGLITGTTC